MIGAPGAEHREAWNAAPFDPIAQAASPIHDALVAALALRRGERLLDVACGTGAISLRAARLGVSTVGLDLAEEMIATARAAAERESLNARFELGNAESLPYRSRSFDVVASAQGVMFTVDHRRSAAELARVCAPGGRIGISVLARSSHNDAFFALWQRFVPSRAGAALDPLRWGDERYVRDLLEEWFELQFVHGDAPLQGQSGEELWLLHRRHCGPLKLLAERLPAGIESQLRASFVEYYERYRDGDAVSAPRPYLLILGRRRHRRACAAAIAARSSNPAAAARKGRLPWSYEVEDGNRGPDHRCAGWRDGRHRRAAE